MYKIFLQILCFLLFYQTFQIMAKKAASGSGAAGIKSFGNKGIRTVSGSKLHRFRFIHSYPSYRSIKPGIKWHSFGSGIIAFTVMSKLAYDQRYFNSYYYDNGTYLLKSNKTSLKGEFCENEEDFNGTVFGKFECPMPEFDLSSKFCCGSSLDKRQFCCNYFDKFGRYESDQNSLISWIIVSVGFSIAIIILIVFLIRKIIKRLAYKTQDEDEITTLNNQNIFEKENDYGIKTKMPLDSVHLVREANHRYSDDEEPPNYKNLLRAKNL